VCAYFTTFASEMSLSKLSFHFSLAFSERPMWYPPPLIRNYTTTVTNSEVIGDSKVATIVASVSFALLVLLLVLGVYGGMRYRRLRTFLSKDEIKEFLNGLPQQADTLEGNISFPLSLQFRVDYELSFLDISIGI